MIYGPFGAELREAPCLIYAPLRPPIIGRAARA
jgi:hypothetical protein